MLNLIATMHVFTTAFQNRVKDLRSEERGSVTLEQVVITVALLAAAVGLVAVIAQAVTSRSSGIN